MPAAWGRWRTIGWVAPVMLSVISANAQAATQTVLHSFHYPPKGAAPDAGVTRDANGTLYGTTCFGGTANQGTIYKVSRAGQLVVLYDFPEGIGGLCSAAGLTLDSSGNLYGTTSAGGTGTALVYQLSPSGQFTVLYSFGESQNLSGVTLDAAGNLYGTNATSVYKLTPAGNETDLHTFTGGTDGDSPAGVILDSSGNLYGATGFGGSSNAGVVYKLSPKGRETILYTFTGGADGGLPAGALIQDTAGNLYGTTYSGGLVNSNCAGGCGVVFKVSPAGQETVLYTFTGGANGGKPAAGVVADSAGNLFGTAGVVDGTPGDSSLAYELSASGQETVLYTFTAGAVTSAGVTLDSAGNVYGTTYSGGAGWGKVFRVTPAGQETALAAFPAAADGTTPYAGVVRDAAGNLYGTTSAGGTGLSPVQIGFAANAGVVYKLDKQGRQTILHNFSGGSDGGTPYGGVTLDATGNLYGTTIYGGTFDEGVIYRVGASGNFSVLYNFTGGSDGGRPYAGVILDGSGNLYGTTFWGGAAGKGVVYKLDTSGNQTVLYSFAGLSGDGANPYAGVVLDSSGNLYGTTYGGGSGNCGTIYRVASSGQESVLYSFTGEADCDAVGGVILDALGNLYGTARGSGYGPPPLGFGLAYKASPSGVQTILHNFQYYDGAAPESGLIFDSSGNLYGTTMNGGIGTELGFGVVYELSPSGSETVLYEFTGAADGALPYAGVIMGKHGNLYGTTEAGGAGGAGVVYQLKLP